jgi:hypothetical protein
VDYLKVGTIPVVMPRRLQQPFEAGGADMEWQRQ